MATDDPTTGPGGRPPVRIGDAERQRMIDLLQRHVAAGRLDMPEYERRVEHATAAIHEQDLAGLLDDLPSLDEDGEPLGRRDPGRNRSGDDGWEQPSWWPPSSGGRSRGPWVRGVPFPLVALAAIALVIASHGWILLPLALLLFAPGAGCRPWQDVGASHDRGEHGRDNVGVGGGGRGPQWPGRFDPFGDERRM